MAVQAPERPSSLVESHKGYDPRLIAFYFIVAALLLVLAGGLAYQQLFRSDVYHEREKQQTQRRILIPGPRGNIYDREGRLLVGNRARFAVTLYLDELRKEFRRESIKVRKNYRDLGDKDIPSAGQMELIARYAVVQRYLDQVNRVLGRNEKVDGPSLNKHFRSNLLLPYILLDDLSAEEYAKLLEQLPVQSPLQVYASSTRYYPYRSAAAHTLGYVTGNEDIAVAEDFPGADLTTFKMRGTEGKTGVEKEFENTLQGETGGSIYRVDPAGFRIDPPLAKRLPIQGKDVVTSLDIDLQQVAERSMDMTEMNCATVMMDIATGEVLVLASKPDYDLNDTSPRLKTEAAKSIEERGAWLNRATQGAYAPGSSFKILVSVAGMRHGTISADSTTNCPGFYLVGNRSFPCHDRHPHGLIDLSVAIEKSCNVFFYEHGIMTGPDAIANEARRFGFGKRTGIELPYETGSTLVPDPAWKKKAREASWTDGDTANYSIGQGFLLVTPLQMASFISSFARREVRTQPTILHDPSHPRQHTEPIGISVQDYAAIVEGMEQCTNVGTGKRLTHDPHGRIEGLRVAGKTGTAQAPSPKGMINLAWFICFAPIENPKVAMAIMVEGDTPGEETGGGVYSVPIAYEVLKAWWKKTNQAAVAR
ncbi:MAG TPA: penicillin-binding transpeptidase domain-containing protein [Opitutaceae bacterium]|nr:penicillin-binding transpeptidase domain-containing protein [Opitutaceae bacterium]